MGFLIFLCIAVLLALVVVFVGAPLRGAAQAGERRMDEVHETRSIAPSAREGLEAAREAKYREIREAELDFRTGKLSEQDYAAIDAELRAEALRILDALGHEDPAASSEPSAAEPG